MAEEQSAGSVDTGDWPSHGLLRELEELRSSDEEGHLINLQDLADSAHPTLLDGEFSVFNHPDVAVVRSKRDLHCNIDLDGVVVLSKKLSTFRIGRFGEARVHFNKGNYSQVTNVYQLVSKSQLFPPLPPNLANFEKWLPSFKVTDGLIAPVRVVLRPKPHAAAEDVEQFRSHSSLSLTWWNSVLLPAIGALPPTARTRRFNTVATFVSTEIMPECVRLYPEDVEDLDELMADATQHCSLGDVFELYFLSELYGQRQQLEQGQEMGPLSFGLGTAFDLSECYKFSAHVALNISSRDPAYSLFWLGDNTSTWSGTRDRSAWTKNRYPLFGLQELGNVAVKSPNNPNLEGAVGNYNIVHVQHYTPTVKAMHERTPLLQRPHLLTFILGEQYISRRAKFMEVWREVSTERTLKELVEVHHPDVPLEARLEVVITEDSPSFLSSFNHRAIIRTLVVDRLLVKIPRGQYPGYVRSLVNELYDPLRAAAHGRLAGRGAFPTIMLCESLLSYLPTRSGKDVPYRDLKAYDVMPSRSTLVDQRRIDLRPHATIRDGRLYVRRERFEKVWVPLGSLPASARATASQLLKFLERVRVRARTSGADEEATDTAAEIIAVQFKYDMLETETVANLRLLDGDIPDERVVDTTTAEEYVNRVFRVDLLTADMSSKGFLRMATDLLDEEGLKRALGTALLRHFKAVPRTTVHAGTLHFSSSQLTLLFRGSLSSLYDDDAERLVVAAKPLITKHFADINRRKVTQLTRPRPSLTRTVRKVVRAVGRRTPNTRQLLPVVCVSIVALGKEEDILTKDPVYRKLYRVANLSRLLTLRDVRRIVQAAVAGEVSD